MDLNVARGVLHIHTDPDEPADTFHCAGSAPEAHLNHLSSGHDPSLLVSIVGQEQDDTGGLSMYQASVPTEQQPFDFALLESYAHEEKTRLGIQSSISTSPPNGPLSSGRAIASTVSAPQNLLTDVAGDFSVPLPAPRTRQHKPSQSAPRPQRAKMALFEHNASGALPALGYRSLLNDTGQVLDAIQSYDHLPAMNTPDFGRQNTAGSGHDRLYRFSFYSNALSATIHA